MPSFWTTKTRHSRRDHRLLANNHSATSVYPLVVKQSSIKLAREHLTTVHLTSCYVKKISPSNKLKTEHRSAKKVADHHDVLLQQEEIQKKNRVLKILYDAACRVTQQQYALAASTPNKSSIAQQKAAERNRVAHNSLQWQLRILKRTMASVLLHGTTSRARSGGVARASAGTRHALTNESSKPNRSAVVPMESYAAPELSRQLCHLFPSSLRALARPGKDVEVGVKKMIASACLRLGATAGAPAKAGAGAAVATANKKTKAPAALRRKLHALRKLRNVHFYPTSISALSAKTGTENSKSAKQRRKNRKKQKRALADKASLRHLFSLFKHRSGHCPGKRRNRKLAAKRRKAEVLRLKQLVPATTRLDLVCCDLLDMLGAVGHARKKILLRSASAKREWVVNFWRKSMGRCVVQKRAVQAPLKKSKLAKLKKRYESKLAAKQTEHRPVPKSGIKRRFAKPAIKVPGPNATLTKRMEYRQLLKKMTPREREKHDAKVERAKARREKGVKSSEAQKQATKASPVRASPSKNIRKKIEKTRKKPSKTKTIMMIRLPTRATKLDRARLYCLRHSRQRQNE